MFISAFVTRDVTELISESSNVMLFTRKKCGVNKYDVLTKFLTVLRYYNLKFY